MTPAILEVVAIEAITHIELIADNRKEHRMTAEKKLAIDDGVKAEIGRYVWSASGVPTALVALFRIRHVYFVRCGM